MDGTNDSTPSGGLEGDANDDSGLITQNTSSDDPDDVTSQVKTGTIFNPAQSWQSFLPSPNINDPATSPGTTGNGFTTGVDDGQFTTPVASPGNEDNGSNLAAGENYIKPEMADSYNGMTSINEFQNPATTIAFSPENTGSSPGLMPIIDPAIPPPAPDISTEFA